MAASSKGRYWSCVLYEDSLNADWEERLLFRAIPCALSPWHDKDKNPDGQIKKKHRHCIICFNGPVTQDYANRVAKEIFNGTVCIKLDSVRGMYRYFTHIDNPDKYQYDSRDIKHYNGFDIDDYCTKTNRELRILSCEIEDFICKNKVREYAIMCNLCRLNEMWEWYDYLESHTYHFSKYFMSLRESGFFDE